MSDPPGTWTATVTIRLGDPRIGRMLERAMRPEAEREVPRARAELRRTEDGAVTLEITARDTGALRAALNTYLGWIHLALETVRRDGTSTAPTAGAGGAAHEALMFGAE